MPVTVKFTTLVGMFDALTAKFADESRPLMMYKSDGRYEHYTYDECRRFVERCGNGLAANGVRRGDMIALLSENRPEWVFADMGMMKLGAVNVSIYPTSTPKQIEFIFNDAGVKFAIVSNQLQLSKILKIAPEVKTLERIIVLSPKGVEEDECVIPYAKLLEMGEQFGREHPRHLQESSALVAPDDLITLIYTSGTTGNPKGVMLTHRNLSSNVIAAADCIPFSEEDILLSFLPLCHSYERMAGYYTALACGATIAYAESIDTVRDNLLEVHPTVVTTVPRLFERIYNRLMKQISSHPPARQRIFHWAIAVGKRVVREKRAGHVSLFLKLQHRVADALVFKKIMERTGGRIKYFVSGGAALPKSLGEFFEAVGIPILEGYGLTETSPVVSVNRLNEYKFGSVGKPIADVTVKIAGDGEILVKGPNVMRGYWGNEEATREVIDTSGWFHTGDIGMFDADGFLVITDRKKHLFVSSGGKNIAPQPIENSFLLSRYIDQFVLIGDGKMYLTALIVPEFDALREYARQNNLPAEREEEIIAHGAVLRLFEGEIASLQRDAAPYERVRRFTLLPAPFTLEGGELTPTQKVKRKVVEERNRHHIEKMYEGIS